MLTPTIRRTPSHGASAMLQRIIRMATGSAQTNVQHQPMKQASNCQIRRVRCRSNTGLAGSPLRDGKVNTMTKTRVCGSLRSIHSWMIPGLFLPLLFAGCGGSTTSTSGGPTVNISASPASITTGSSSTLTVTATNATQVKVTGTDGITYTLTASGGIQVVSPIATTTYTATATGAGGTTISPSATVTATSTSNSAPTVTIIANPPLLTAGGSPPRRRAGSAP